MFGPRRIRCPAGEWTRIISSFASGYPRTFRVQLATDAGAPVQGDYVEKRAFWIVPQAAAHGSLAPAMQFHRRWINAIYSVTVRPTADSVAVVE